MTVVNINEKGSPMMALIDDPQLRERVLDAQTYLHEQYNALGTWVKVAKTVKGLSLNQINAFIGGSYRANPTNIVVAIERSRALAEERSATVFAPVYVETSIAKRIRRAVKQTRARGQLGLIAGQSGVGKSTSFAELCAGDPTFAYVRCNPTFGSRLFPVMVAIRERFGLGGQEKRGATPSALYELLRSTLATSGRTIILDEAQFLCRQALDTLRVLSEDAETPIVFSGNETIHEAAWFAGHNPAAFVQFTSRCSVNEFLRRQDITRGDVDLIAGQKLDDETLEETRDALLVEARSDGGFRRLHTVLQRANEKARGQRVSADQVLSAIAENNTRRGGAR